MYNNGQGATTLNNPFAPNPTGPQSRFPDISANGGSPPPNQFGSWQPHPGMPMQAPQQFMQQQQPQLTGLPFSNPGLQFSSPTPTFNNTGYMSPQAMSPQQTSAYGQPWMGGAPAPAAPQLGSSYSYLYQNGQQQQAVTPAQQQIQNNPGYIPQFDPYSSLGQAQWDAGASSTSGQPQSQSSMPTTSSGPAGVAHPRDYIRAHKAEIDSWDTYAWKQLIGAFDSVKDAWAARKKELEQNTQQLNMQLQYGGGGYHPMQLQQEIMRYQGLIKDADSNFDTAAAGSFQMHEVFQNYRQSGDLSSKRRVREACNATLNGCPDWPPALF